jgi:hypothetical protein
MSPVSRGRKGRPKKASPRPTLPALETCDCLVCSALEPGAHERDVAELADGLIGTHAHLIDDEDPVPAEFSAATLVEFERWAGEDMLVDELVPTFEARGSRAALNLLAAVACVATGRLSAAAAEAADRLVLQGVQAPTWAGEVREPVTASECFAVGDDRDDDSLLVATFTRAGRSHSIVLGVDRSDCGAASHILLLDSDEVDEVVRNLRDGLGIRSGKRKPMDPVDFRWAVEEAMGIRSAHDADETVADYLVDDDDHDDSPSHASLAALLRARLRSLPEPARPHVPHIGESRADRAEEIARAALAALPKQLGGGRAPAPKLPAPMQPGGWREPARKQLPAKRKKSGPPAPAYRIKVSLRDAKPPIWRRLEVPGDMSLADLSEVIQVAFGWRGHHLHVFETPYGDFGQPDPDMELDHRPEAPVTLEQVAPEVKSKILYTYDFGDGWDHDIVVEQIGPRDRAVDYPRCTGGRRAAPPDDCGGMPGYADLIRVLGQPTDPEHDRMVAWLGLGSAAEFDPDAFDARLVSEALRS